jgi:hypothetical protein
LYEDRTSAAAESNGTAVSPPIDHLHSGHRIPSEHAEESVPGKRLTIRERQPERRGRVVTARSPRRTNRILCARTAAQRARTHPISLTKDRVEPSETLKPARVCNARDRERGVGEQTFREQEPVCLRELDRRDARFALERTSQMPFADTQVASKLTDGAIVERAGGNAMRGNVREARDGIDDRASRRKLGTATETRPIPRALGRGGRVEEPTALGVRYARRTDRSAVHARRGDADEEESVEPCIPRA